MLNESEMLEPARRRSDAPVLRIVPIQRGAAPDGGTQRRPASAAPNVRRGVPRTAEEWTALVKVGSGERDIPAAQCSRLVAMGLVLTVSGVPALTRHGRFTLGLPD